MKLLGYVWSAWRFYIDTKDLILKKARKLFAKHGFEGSSIRSICEKATCNVSAISYHFGSKEELYRECLKQDGAHFLHLVETILTPAENAADLKVKMKMFITQFFDYAVENRELILIISRDVNSKFAMESLNNVFHQFPELLAKFFKEAQEKKIIRPEIVPAILGDLFIQPIFMQVLFAESNKNYKQKNLSDPIYRQQVIDQQLFLFSESIIST